MALSCGGTALRFDEACRLNIGVCGFSGGVIPGADHDVISAASRMQMTEILPLASENGYLIDHNLLSAVAPSVIVASAGLRCVFFPTRGRDSQEGGPICDLPSLVVPRADSERGAGAPGIPQPSAVHP